MCSREGKFVILLIFVLYFMSHVQKKICLMCKCYCVSILSKFNKMTNIGKKARVNGKRLEPWPKKYWTASSNCLKNTHSVSINILYYKLMLIENKENSSNELNKEIKALLPAIGIESDVGSSIEYAEGISLWKQRIKIQIVK